jgi:hypothetical protein
MRFDLDGFSVNHTLVWFNGDNLLTLIGFGHALTSFLADYRPLSTESTERLQRWSPRLFMKQVGLLG